MGLEQAFVIGDIHGMRGRLKELLSYWLPDREQLIFLGDYIDRGPDSYEVIRQLNLLQKKYGAICLRGNHEQILLDFMNEPDKYYENYLENGGLTTMVSFLALDSVEVEKLSPAEISERIQSTAPWLEAWIEGLDYYYEFGDFIIVHAGVDLTLPDWRKTSSEDFMWIRKAFHQTPNNTGKSIIFGHTPWQLLTAEYGSYNFLYSENKIPIDGGAVYGGPLVGLRIKKDQVIEQIEIS